MKQRIGKLFESLLRWLLPATGQHRTTEINPSPIPAPDLVVSLPPVEPAPRPFLLEHGRRILEERMRQQERRRTLWLALHGIDLDPGPIHGAKVGDQQ